MKFCLCLYDLKGKRLAVRCFSCSGCGWKYAPTQTPACLRERTKEGKIVRRNQMFIDKEIEKKIK